jgi:delta 1-pyrroline-5-carboxylate dehydrogenase
MNLIKTQPPIVTEPAQDDYTLRYTIRYRRNWTKMQPEQQAVILRAAADYLESEVAGMRERAETLVNGH